MALNSNAFVEGIDPTATFGGYASVLLQLIRQALPSSTYGMVLYDSATPDVSGANAWRQRCVWLDMTDTANPIAKVYRTTGSPGWVSVISLIVNNTITTAMIQDAAVTLAKLSVAGGAANQLIRVNAGATAFEFVNFSSLFTVGVVPINSIVTTAVPPSVFRVLGSFGGAASTWFTADYIASELSVGSVDAVAVAPAATLSAASRFLTSRTSDTGAVWRLFDPAADVADGGISGVKLTTNTVNVNKLIAGTETYILKTVGGMPTWVAPTSVTNTYEEAFVFDTGNFNTAIAFNKDIALTLPAGKEWKDLELNLLFSNTGGGATTATATIKWNTAPETGTVAVSSSAGCGQNTLTLSGGHTGSFRWKGIVPASIDATNITVRIEVTITGAAVVANSRYELSARATANV
jgi:hypothetical protein